MGLNLAENIRKNRRNHNLSQEVFAERLGVSFQTVSKWERGECYPDIELLPKIANFFGITIDTLMGADLCKEQEFVDELQEELRRYDLVRDEAALVRCAENGLKKYPNNPVLMAWIVYGAQNIKPQRSIELGEYLLAHCRDPHILNWVRAELCYAYCHAGQREKGIETARHLPTAAQTRNMVLADLLDGKEQAVHILEADIAKVCYRYKASVLKLLNHYEPREQIELLQKSNAVYNAVYETDDCYSVLKEKADNYVRIAEICAHLGEAEKARENIDQALLIARKHDSITYGTRSQALLCGCEKYGYNVVQSGKLAHPYGKLAEVLIHSLEVNPAFVNIWKKTQDR